MNCPHLRKRIDGIYTLNGNIPYMLAWTCEDCKSSGGKKWADATHGERIEAGLVQMARDSKSEMMIDTNTRT